MPRGNLLHARTAKTAHLRRLTHLVCIDQGIALRTRDTIISWLGVFAFFENCKCNKFCYLYISHLDVILYLHLNMI